ncbi:MAG TPA: glutamine-hydrolyzing GMP synthase [Chloroflexi bacterium]|nr:glutamine-hydrolyzing GMP synthase [Chloroflexota bacterium]
MSKGIVVLDFGSQTAQLIARRVREAQVYCELFPWDAPAEEVMALDPAGFILSGGPASVYTQDAPFIQDYILESGKPVLGICYGAQALTQALGGRVAPASEREYGQAHVTALRENPLISPGVHTVLMSHGDRIEALPPGFVVLAASPNSPVAAMWDPDRCYYGLQFHPEVQHTPGGQELLRRFVVDICGVAPNWTPDNIVAEEVERIRAQVGEGRVLAAVSGGVDSTVAAALVHRAVGDRLTPIFVDTGLLRKGEREQVEEAFRTHIHANLIVVDASQRFLDKLRGVTDPEAKRRIIGETFIRVFEAEARKLAESGQEPEFLVQGTIYPDVVESRAPERGAAAHIKTHHNVGGLPKDLRFKLVEPLRYMFKDEVRAVGEALGLPSELVWRQPFPGPGLAVRCLGEVTAERLTALRAADAIFTEELTKAGLLGRKHSSMEEGVAQGFAVLLPVQSVGVMGDQRTYQETVALRAVTSQDFMTADWARLPMDLLARAATRIVNEVDGINRVVYDITSKPPATIEWE